MKCINCRSTKTVKNGFDNKGVQRFKCNGCGRRFCEKGFFARFRNPIRVIITAVRWKMKRMSLREISDEVADVFRIIVSHVTIWNWCMKFISLLVLWASLIDDDYKKIIHVDEKFIKVGGSKDKFAYLFVAIDSGHKVIATFVADSRTIKSAKVLMKKVGEKIIPEIIVTDKCQIYNKSCKVFGRKTKHVKAHFKAEGIVYNGKIFLLSNNRVERFNSDIDLFLHVFRGLKSFETAEIWIQGLAIYHNYLKPSKINWHRIPKMITSQRQVIPQIIFWIYLSPFKLTEAIIQNFLLFF